MFSNFKNLISSWKLGWRPCDLHPSQNKFNVSLQNKIEEFQKIHDIEETGVVDAATFRRIETEKEAREELIENYIICNGTKVVIDWDKVVPLDDPNGFALKKGFKKSVGIRKIQNIVTHWDAALSAESCYKILKKKGISSHFCIDNDGTIFQMVDPKDIAWHAGPVKGDRDYWKKKGLKRLPSWNNNSIGIDFSNAYYEKYNKIYEKRGFGPRPVITSKLHGRTLGPHLGYYPKQLAAYVRLVDVLCNFYSIPFEVPKEDDESLSTRAREDCARGTFQGVICHYNLTGRKIDCAGLELDKLIESAKLG